MSRAAERRKAKAARQKARTARQQKRQSSRSDRQAARQAGKTARAEARNLRKTAKIQAKGASGYWSPEGVQARGAVAGNLVGQGLEAGSMVAGALVPGLGAVQALGGALGGGSLGGAQGFDTPIDRLPQPPLQDPMMGGLPMLEPEPWYQNPAVLIGGAVVVGAIAFFGLRGGKKK